MAYSDLAVGVDLGGTLIKVGLVRKGEGLIRQAELDTGAAFGPDYVLARIRDGVQSMIDAAGAEDVCGVGIGAPGSVDWDRTTVVQPSNLPGWMEVNLSESLCRLLGRDLPVIVENDANVAAFGSYFYGAGKPFDSFIMITLGTGVGGAIIYQGKLFRGMTGAAGEIGHMSIDPNGPFARSGVAGAIEAYLGQRFLSHHARMRLINEPDSLVHGMAKPDLEDINPKMLFDAASAGDEPAIRFFAWAGHKLGWVLSSSVNLLDIRKIVVGGGVSAAGDFILEPARRTMREGVMPALQEGLEIVRETLGNEVGMLGAAHLAFEYQDEHPPARA